MKKLIYIFFTISLISCQTKGETNKIKSNHVIYKNEIIFYGDTMKGEKRLSVMNEIRSYDSISIDFMGAYDHDSVQLVVNDSVVFEKELNSNASTFYAGGVILKKTGEIKFVNLRTKKEYILKYKPEYLGIDCTNINDFKFILHNEVGRRIF